MLTVTKIFYFDASHKLPYHEGKCHNLHGHTYRLEVTVEGKKQPISQSKSDSGMVMDFHELSSIVEENIIKVYDHAYLNDTFITPTAETMIEGFAHILNRKLPPHIKLRRLHLWEGRDSYVGWKPDNE